ncbi:hypothetical protein GQ457_10G007580 [Hibiscus cannabinus]
MSLGGKQYAFVLTFFLGYSLNSKAYHVFTKRTLVFEESTHVVFDDNLILRKDTCDDDDDVAILNANDGERQSSKVDEVLSKEEPQDPPLEALPDMSLKEMEVTYLRESELVPQGYTEEDETDFDETCAPVARTEAIRILLAFGYFHEFKNFQMDVFYVEQPPGVFLIKCDNTIFYSNARCNLNEAKTKTIAIESYLMGKIFSS